MNFIDFFSSLQELYDRTLSPVCDEYALSSMELTILLFLENNPEYDTAAEIVRKRHLSKSHVSISIRSLEEKGFLRKEQRGGNHRSDYLVLCDASKDIVKTGIAAQDRFLTLLSTGVSGKQKNDMFSILEVMNKNVTQALEDGTK